ncbi:glycoside hydrolase family 31 protein [Rufibacter aurantiacus]|uniref:glycoside hydrolase family 31 protein n=1 Tax=Rufibacter aurantiacus TaxID=2817374 RepID=UPI001B3178B9|nr:glycoside hydrolase family 31 protein [Rufibacter aurantiacus]
MKILCLVLGLFLAISAYSQDNTEIKFQKGEAWYVGIIDKGHLMPLIKGFGFDMVKANTYNQLQPLFISSKGRYLFTEEPVAFVVNDNGIEIEGRGNLIVQTAGKTLKEAYREVASKHFSFKGQVAHPDLFRNPQYNTWIELTYNQNQKDVLGYAQSMLKNGMPPGVIMIDDTWQHDYGVWEFDANKFPDPKAMMDTLHSLGFKVMLWVCPFVSPDSREYRQLIQTGGLLLNSEGTKPMMVDWWNGISAVIDLSHPNGAKWFKGRLDYLQNKYGVDGFKFDAGDIRFYNDGKSYGNISPHQQSMLFNKLGIDYPLNEYRAAWKVGGEPLAQRLADKAHNWEDLQKLIPQITLQGLMGYPFSCPDMIGGGEFGSFLDLKQIDQELIVRSAQCHAFMPMMQFSVNPFRILDQKHVKAVKEAVVLRQKFVPIIMELVKSAAQKGEPVVRMMEYEFPNQGFEKINDQFMLGNTYLIAPILTKGAASRKIALPQGQWQDQHGKIWKGNITIDYPADLETIPYFTRVKS